jgi:hypothetical protein
MHIAKKLKSSSNHIMGGIEPQSSKILSIVA